MRSASDGDVVKNVNGGPSRSLRVAIVGEKFPPLGGGISTAHYNLYHLLKTDHHVKLFAFGDHDRPSDSLVIRGKPQRILSSLFEFLLAVKVRRHSPGGAIDACKKIAQTAAVILGMNGYINRFNPDIVIVCDFSLPSLALRRKHGAKMIWIAHHNYQRFRNQRLIDGPCDYDLFLAHRLERRAVKKCDHVIFVSDYMGSVFRETLNNEMPGTVINNYFALNEYKFDKKSMRDKVGIGEDEILIVIPSGGTQVKGSRFTPEIIRRLHGGHQNIAFYIPGPVDRRTAFELNYLSRKINIVFPGNVSHEENIRYLSACDLCISPGIIENYSLALLEALSLGVPCVTFDVGGNSEIVTDGQCGYIVEFLDIDALCDRATEIICEPALRLRLSRSATDRAEHLCSAEVTRGKWNNLFLSLTESKD